MKTVGDAEVVHALVRRLRALRPDAQPRWGTLTPHEMLCHLGDTSAGVLGEREWPLPHPLPPRPLVKIVGLWLPAPWRGRSAGSWNDPRRDGSPPGDYARDLERAVSGVQRIGAATRMDGWAPGHSIFGRMSLREWQRYTYRHTHYHLRQFAL